MHILSVAETIEEFDVDMYFALIENIVVNDSRMLTMSLRASEECSVDAKEIYRCSTVIVM